MAGLARSRRCAALLSYWLADCQSVLALKGALLKVPCEGTSEDATRASTWCTTVRSVDCPLAEAAPEESRAQTCTRDLQELSGPLRAADAKPRVAAASAPHIPYASHSFTLV